jgi:hypothetical protein
MIDTVEIKGGGFAPGRASRRNITSVYIRGLAFKCTLGGRREQVLLKLKKADEKDTDWLALLAVACFVGGFGAGVLAAWYL